METREISKTLRFKLSVVDKVQKLAEKNNRTFANMVETILLNYESEAE